MNFFPFKGCSVLLYKKSLCFHKIDFIALKQLCLILPYIKHSNVVKGKMETGLCF